MLQPTESSPPSEAGAKEARAKIATGTPFCSLKEMCTVSDGFEQPMATNRLKLPVLARSQKRERG